MGIVITSGDNIVTTIVTLINNLQIEQYDGVIILATNRQQDLDEAMHRRFGIYWKGTNLSTLPIYYTYEFQYPSNIPYSRVIRRMRLYPHRKKTSA